MRICFLYPHLFGYEGYVRDINALHQALSQHSIHQFSLCPPTPDIRITGQLGRDEIKLIKPLWSILRDVDAVHVFGFFFPLYPLLVKLIQLSGKPYVLSPLAQLEPFALQTSHVRKALFIHAFGKGMLEKAAAVHAFSDSEARSIRAISEKANVLKAPLGIYFEDIPIDIEAPTSEIASSYFLFFGRLSYFHKGIDVLLDAYALYSKRGGETQLVIAGKSWQGSHARIRSRIQELKLDTRVRFLGEVPLKEKYALMKQCKAFVYSSRCDGPPRPIREALALRKPLLISHQSNLISSLESYGWGYTFDPVPQELALAMQRMDDEYDSGCYREPKEILSWNRVASHYARVYDQLLPDPVLELIA